MFDDPRHVCVKIVSSRRETVSFGFICVSLATDPIDSEQLSFEPKTVPPMAGTVEAKKAGRHTNQPSSWSHDCDVKCRIKPSGIARRPFGIKTAGRMDQGWGPARII